jgi:Restriction endonuclease.
MPTMDLEAALQQFDATEANVVRLEAVWSELESMIPHGVAFFIDGPEARRYQELTLAYDDLVRALPAVNGYQITAKPTPLNAIGQARFDIMEVGELSDTIAFDESVVEPGAQLAEYRFRFDKVRREMVRDEVAHIAGAIATLLADLGPRHPATMDTVVDPQWDALGEHIRQIERLAGGQVPRTKAWGDLQRHVRFAQGQDLHDIIRVDWPAVQSELRKNLYTELEPLPVAVADLADVARERPTGVVTTALAWVQLDDEGFERLIFTMISNAEEYENPQWLTHTNAPDRGRDLSAELVHRDSLSGTTRERVIIQARNWLKNSVGVDDVATLLAQMKLWEPPAVRVLIVATSGRFATDAVDWIESHNERGERPRIEMWASSHLELILSRKPHIAAAFDLR